MPDTQLSKKDFENLKSCMINIDLLDESVSLPDEEILNIIKENINFTNRQQTTLLHRAAEKGYENVVRFLLENGAELTTTIYGCTPLHHSTNNESPTITKLLLEYKNGTDSLNQGDITPLWYAIQLKHPDVARLLIDNNADVLLTTKNKNTYLHAATRYGLLDTIQLLIEKGVPIDHKNAQDKTPIDWALAELDKARTEEPKKYIDAIKVLLVEYKKQECKLTEEDALKIYSSINNIYNKTLIPREKAIIAQNIALLTDNRIKLEEATRILEICTQELGSCIKLGQTLITHFIDESLLPDDHLTASLLDLQGEDYTP